MTTWTTSDVPSQRGRSVVVTGTGGLGYETAVVLSQAGADVILAGRNPAKGEESVRRIRAAAPGSSIRFERLDLANLASVQAFSARLQEQRDSLDLLINNAAVMMPPQRHTTDDGFELQFGTNYLGHFALTAHLRPLLSRGNNPCVITLSSIANRNATINFDDLQSEKTYKPTAAYGQSKLACLMFALELQRRSTAAGWGLTSMAAHPGISRTDLLHNGAGRQSALGLGRTYLWFLFQPAPAGAWPTLFAATSPAAHGGAYYGPQNLGETRGAPIPARIPPAALDEQKAAQLWAVSERLSGFPFTAAE